MTDSQRKELTDLGFQQDSAKRGIVTWIMAILSVLLFGSVSLNVLQQRNMNDLNKEHNQDLKELNEAHNQVLLKLLDKAREVEKNVDTVIQKKI